MLKVILLVALALGSTNAELWTMNAVTAKEFIAGFITGLGNGPTSTCSTALSTLITVGFKVIQDFEVPNNSVKQDIITLNDMQTLVNSVSPISQCNFSLLDDQVKKIFSKGGFEMLIENYLNNGAAIYSDLHVFEKCSVDYTACGQAYGNAFKNLVGWSLN